MNTSAEYDLVQLSPVASHTAGRQCTGTLGYGWMSEDPLAVTLRITLALNTFDVHSDVWPLGITCSGCPRKIAWGAFACQPEGGPLLCLACAHKMGQLGLVTKDWKIGLSLFHNLVSGEDTVDYMPGEIQMYRTANGEVAIVFSNRDTKESARITAPYANLEFFLKRLSHTRQSLGEVEKDYLNSSVAEIERFLDQVE